MSSPRAEIHSVGRAPRSALQILRTDDFNGNSHHSTENPAKGFLLDSAVDPAKKNSLAYSKKLPRPKPVYLVDFFCGCGGMSWGFANTRQSHIAYQVLAGIDIDAYALATYRRNLPDARAIRQDVRNFVGNAGAFWGTLGISDPKDLPDGDSCPKIGSAIRIPQSEIHNPQSPGLVVCFC